MRLHVAKIVSTGSNLWFSISYNQLDQMQTSNEFLEIVQPQFENWLDDNIGSGKWENVTNAVELMQHWRIISG